MYSIDPLSPPLPFLLAEHVLLHLAGRGLRQVAELDRGGAREVGDLVAAEGDELAGGREMAGLDREERLRPLAPGVVGDGDDRALEHRRVPRDRLLDLDGRDVLAAGDDDVLLAVAELDVAVGVPDADV